MKIIDMHCDTIYEIQEAKKRGEAVSLRDNQLMVNLRKMKTSGYSVQNFALYIEKEDEVSSFGKVQDLLKVFKEEMKIQSDYISQVTTAQEIVENERAGKLSAFLTVEGGEACEGSLEKLRYLYDQGVRMITLTWNFPNEIGYPNFRSDEKWNAPETKNGLTEFGIQAVEEMERLGIIVDVSHLSDAGFYDVLKYTKKPFVASHSNARSVCPHVRNLTDDMIRKIAERGGVIGLNYHSKFLAEEYNLPDVAEQKHVNRHRAVGEYEKEDVFDRDTTYLESNQDQVQELIMKHARHITNIGGIECLGLGSDFDGIPSYHGMPRIEDMEQFADVLQRNGFHESEIEKIFYQNVFRLYKDVLR